MAHLFNETARLLSNENVGPNLYLAVLQAPLICAEVKPGQFVHMQVPTFGEHILRRPFSVYGRNLEAGSIDVLYQDVGSGSHHMTLLDPNHPVESTIDLIGPVGNTWSAYRHLESEERRKWLLVGGGVGAAPLFMLAEALQDHGSCYDVVIGAQTKYALVTRDRYERLMGKEPLCATDDGSYGRPGFCTSLVEERLAEGALDGSGQYDGVAVCGPPPLMKIVAGLAERANVPCDVSLERRMACGVGACLSCVVDTTSGKKRACVDGPIFDAAEVVW